MKAIVMLFFLVVLTGCLGMPERVSPVTGFEADRYLGTWYEVARLDHSFERGLKNISATYSKRDDGGINVLNRGYSIEDQEWNQAQGKAYFVEDERTGYLKVSFFGPFYGSYVVFDLDKEGYEYAFISGPDTDYLWLLARTPNPGEAVINRFKTVAKAKGFDTNELIFVEHDDL
ncbi:lipocalin [Bermanella marisrubri]|uniref:Outer membrane lipoprotein Blc n=2 Tax=Bermanella marisrubri TaxID=207949 RepID=Q1N061_9GAMM|nr:lipoprotein Blc [Oceanobacter sp. RED65] [Bermanella marisrubri]QIZ85736.1 lipocalin [Bermanella marisrubri]